MAPKQTTDSDDDDDDDAGVNIIDKNCFMCWTPIQNNN